MSKELDELERQCIEQIEAIKERARREAEPIARHLAIIRALRPRVFVLQEDGRLLTMVPISLPNSGS